MEKGLELLTTHTTNIPERHRSLKAAFEYSWTLLSNKEQETLRKLSVFRGGFRREAASDIAGATIPVLASLVDKSLIRTLPSGRYTCHPLLYQYAREKLAEYPLEKQQTQTKHMLYYYGVLQQQETAIRQGKQKDTLRVFQEERDNIQLVIEHGLHIEHVPELLQGLELMDTYYDSRGAYAEALEFLSRAEVMLGESHPAERGQVLAEKAWYLLRLGRYQQAKQIVEEATKLLPAATKVAVWVSVYNIRGVLSRRTGEQEHAKDYYEKALSLARQSSDTMLIAKALASLADEEDRLGHVEVSEQYWLEAIALYQKRGAVIGAVRNLNNLGFHYYMRGMNAKAKPIFEEGLQLARDIEFTQTIPYFLNNLGYIAYDAQEYQRALGLNLEALSVTKETGEKAVQAEILVALARCLSALGQLESAWEYSRQGIEMSREVGYVLILLQGLFARAELYVRLGRFGEAAKLLIVILAHPAATSFEQQPAGKLLEKVRPQLAVKKFLTLEVSMKKMPFETVVKDVLADVFMDKAVVSSEHA
jgi:tetratricopeptide (TPR) repeat protein